MAGLTRNNTRPLLKMVGGKPHAEDDDHEPASKRRRTNTAPATKKQKDIDIHAEPLSSDDELHAPPPRPAKPNKTVAPSQSSIEDLELKKPQRAAGKRGALIRAPKRGAYQTGQTHKGRGVNDNKENAPKSSAGSAKSGPIEWDMQYASQGSSKSVRGYGAKTKNIHAVPSKKYGGGLVKKTYGGEKHPRNKQGQTASRSNSVSPMMSDHELEETIADVQAADSAEDLELRKKDTKAKKTASEGNGSNQALLEDDELSDILDSVSDTPKLRDIKKVSKSAALFEKLNNWKEAQEPSSSQLHSSAQQDNLDDVSNYVKQLPVMEDEGSRCALCAMTVNPEDYWDFWKGKEKTVRNKTAFCNAHQKIEAQKEYTKVGYPPIVWSDLPRRIRCKKMELTRILDDNGRSSIHRDRYEPLALTGKAAAVPSRRQDLSEEQQEELDSYALDDRAAYPGYYGPHGRRIITENVMEMLKTEIKNCKDAVVQASGIAAFVQAVMVPEAAILLIMEDCDVDEDEAERIREKTYEMGLLLHEEIEDQLERRPEDDSDDENEYQR